MRNNWKELNTAQLQFLYENRSKKLEEKLLHGFYWDEVKVDQREVTDLAIAIYQRLNAKECSPQKHPGQKQQ